jgi:hypothetical protein
MALPLNQPRIKLDWAETVPGLVAQFNAILAALAAPENAVYFGPPQVPNPSLSTMADLVQAVVTAQTAARGRGQGTREARDLAVKDLKNGGAMLAAWIQGVVNARPGSASAILAASGYGEKGVGKYSKPDLGVSQKQPGGPVVLDGKAAPRHARAFYGWRYMLPGETTWVMLPNTNEAHTVVTGLPALATVTFAYQITVKSVPGEWSQPVSFLVR